jgi:hypothetical protein
MAVDAVTLGPLRGALLALLLAAGACNEDPPPVAAAKSYAAAVQRGDAKALLDLVDAQTVAYVQDSAERASDQIGGRRNVEPYEMLQVTDVDPKFQVARTELVSSGEDAATVKLFGADGSEHTLDLVREEGQWHVQVPVPRRIEVDPPAAAVEDGDDEAPAAESTREPEGEP